jgi:hypothetical protein
MKTGDEANGCTSFGVRSNFDTHLPQQRAEYMEKAPIVAQNCYTRASSTAPPKFGNAIGLAVVYQGQHCILSMSLSLETPRLV